ncbi:MAG: PaaI family thioesterase [Alphaproteobacteria bacterium]|nr:PaaI family thioesterase [Alphaproteobacteria bacterium]MBF0391284.1 PaaI family thioesterase [Alphaproteobacteria bacterium]
MTRISVDAFEALIRDQLPLVELFGIRTVSIGEGRATLRMHYDPSLLRPGGTVAGPALMALADVAMYAVVLGLIGPVELAVTTNLSINFLRKPPPQDVVAEARILKLGKRLAVAEVLLRTDASEDLVAHVTGTYSIPPERD